MSQRNYHIIKIPKQKFESLDEFALRAAARSCEGCGETEGERFERRDAPWRPMAGEPRMPGVTRGI